MNHKKEIDESHPLYKKSVVMTGFRDKELEEKLKTLGAKVSTSVSKNTFVLLTKNKDESSGKIEDAKKNGVPIMTPEEFSQKYLE
jgi:DNA ligase (NAD+)